MSLDIIRLALGPMDNNTYLIADTAARVAVVVDPSFDSELVLQAVEKQGWSLTGIWLTHAHFDHIAGVQTIQEVMQQRLPVGLHPADLPLWQQGGGARLFGMDLDAGEDPTIAFADGQKLQVGREAVEVRHTPGHTAGHVVFYLPGASALLCGDLIFYHGVGRTDLPGGDQATLLRSIHTQVLTLPSNTRLLSGHGPETSIEEETARNPFLFS